MTDKKEITIIACEPIGMFLNLGTIINPIPMMLAPILGKPIAVNRFYKVPLILIIISLLTRTVGVVYISYFNGNGFTLLHALTSTSGFLIVLAIVIFVSLMYKSIKTNV